MPLSVPDGDGRPRIRLGTGPREALPLIAFHPRGLMRAAIDAHLARLGEAPGFRVLNESIQSGNIKELIGLENLWRSLPAHVDNDGVAYPFDDQ